MPYSDTLFIHSANRAVEVNEMWRIRQKEQELDNRVKRRQGDHRRSDRSYSKQGVDDRLKRRWSDESNSDRSYRDSEVDDRQKRRRSDESSSGGSYKDKSHADVEMSSKRNTERYSVSEEGLKDDEIENFLNSRSVNFWCGMLVFSCVQSLYGLFFILISVWKNIQLSNFDG